MQFMCRVNVCTSVAKRRVDTANEMKRPLTRQQQAAAIEALDVIEPAVRAYLQRNPSYAKILESCDVYSVARLAIADGARTYKPHKSSVSTYFSTVVRNALFKEVQRFKRSKEHAPERVMMEQALEQKASHDEKHVALECLEVLDPDVRSLVEAHIIEGQSLLQIGIAVNRDWRTVKGRILCALDELKNCVDDQDFLG